MFLQHLKRYNIEIIKYQIKCVFEIVILFSLTLMGYKACFVHT